MLKSLPSYIAQGIRPAVIKWRLESKNENITKTYINDRNNTKELHNIIVLTLNNMR